MIFLTKVKLNTKVFNIYYTALAISFQVINKQGKVKNPWKDIKMHSAYILKSLKDVDLKAIKEMMTKPEMRNVIFVRNPYTRLYSGWLDKFYSVIRIGRV